MRRNGGRLTHILTKEIHFITELQRKRERERESEGDRAGWKYRYRFILFAAPPE